MQRIASNQSRWIPSVLAVAVLAACQAPDPLAVGDLTPTEAPKAERTKAPLAVATPQPGPAETPDAVLPSVPPPSVTLRPGPALSGTVTAPSGAEIGDAGPGSSLVHDGGVILFKLLAEASDTKPVHGAQVWVLDAAGDKVPGYSTNSDEAGHYAFDGSPSGRFTVQASFTREGKNFDFKAVHGEGDHTVDIDTATTLIAEKAAVLGKRGKLQAKALPGPALRDFVAALRKALKATDLPYMANVSRDLVATLDQLLLDDPALAKAAKAVGDSLAAPADDWAVSSLLGTDDLKDHGILTGGRSITARCGQFEVDDQGRVFVVSDSVPAKVFRIAEGKGKAIATLPAGIHGPCLLAFDPRAAKLVILARDAEEDLAILEVPHEGGEVSRRAGSFGKATLLLGLASGGRIAVDKAGAIYLAAPVRGVVFKLAPDSTVAEVWAGSIQLSGYKDGEGAKARFNQPIGLATGPDGAIYVADRGNQCIRRIQENNAGKVTVTTVAGAPGKSGDAAYRNGRRGAARFAGPTGLTVDRDGGIFVVDDGAKRVRRISPDGSVFLVAGTGEPGLTDGPGSTARFNRPVNLTTDRVGNLYLADLSLAGDASEVIRKVARPLLP